MIVITSMNELPHSCMQCPFQKNKKTPFCRAKRNWYRPFKNIPPSFGFYIRDDAFLKGQTPWNARAKWCPLIEVADRKTEPTISKMEQVEDEPQTERFWCATCKYNEWDNMNPKCDECIVGEDKPSNYEPQTDCPWK